MTTDNQNLMTAAEESLADAESAAMQTSQSTSDESSASENSGSKDGSVANPDPRDATITALRTQLSSNALQAQIDRIESEADSESTADITAVSDGEMTVEDAQSRATERRTATRTKVTDAANEPIVAEQVTRDKVSDALMAREGFSLRLAKEYGVDSEVLMDDQTITSPEEMQLKAREMQIDQREGKRTGSQSFDSGQRRAASSNVDDMSPLEKVSAGLQ